MEIDDKHALRRRLVLPGKGEPGWLKVFQHGMPGQSAKRQALFEELLDKVLAVACQELFRLQQHACDTVWRELA